MKGEKEQIEMESLKFFAKSSTEALLPKIPALVACAAECKWKLPTGCAARICARYTSG